MKKISIILAINIFIWFLTPVQLAYAEPDVSAESAILITADTGKVLYSNNSNSLMPMASTTKIMTALITLEQDDLDTYFTVDAKAIKVEGSSMGLKEGDQVTLRSLAYGMLLQSGNDAANAAAVYISGDIESFAELMNKKAKEIGMENTSFVTPSGLDDENHYSTAEDMALLAREALKNQNFKEICSTYSVKVSYGNPPYDRWMSNHNRLLKEYDGTIGVKTGFTKKSGRCLVSAVERDGVRLIAVTLNDPDDWKDHKELYEYGFSEVELVNLPDVDCTVKVIGGKKDSVSAVLTVNPTAVLTADELKKVEQKILIMQFYYAPLQEGQVLGSVEYIYNGEVIRTVSLVAEETVEQDEQFQKDKLTILDKLKLKLTEIRIRIQSWLSS